MYHTELFFIVRKLVKNYLRNSISRDYLCCVGLLNFDRNRTSEINIQFIIDNFANAKAREKNSQIICFVFNYWHYDKNI